MVPPASVARISHGLGMPRARGEDHRGNRHDEQEHDDPRLRQLDVGRDRLAHGPAPPGAGSPVPAPAGPGGSPPRGRPTASRRRPARRWCSRSAPTGRRGRPRPRAADASTRWPRRRGSEPRTARAPASKAPRCRAIDAPWSGPDRHPHDEQEHERRQHTMDEHRGRRPAQGGDEPPVHERPVVEGEARAAGPDVGPHEQQGAGGRGRPRRQSREGPVDPARTSSCAAAGASDATAR